MISFIVDSLILLTVALGAEALTFIILEAAGAFGSIVNFIIALVVGFFAAIFVARQLTRF